MKSCNFSRLMFNKVTLRSYDYFPNLLSFQLLEKCFLQLCQNYIVFVRYTQRTLGLNINIYLKISKCFKMFIFIITLEVSWYF